MEREVKMKNEFVGDVLYLVYTCFNYFMSTRKKF